MTKNKIDLIFLNEEIKAIFNEICEQYNAQTSNYFLNILLIDNNNMNFDSETVILDSMAFSKLNHNRIFADKNLFLIQSDTTAPQYLSEDVASLELINLPINVMNFLNKVLNFLDQKNFFIKNIKNYKKFRYSFQLKTIYNKENFLYLTDKENEIFKVLIDHKSKPLDKKTLLSKVWNYSEGIDTHTLETHIYTMRYKIEKSLQLVNLILHQDDGYFINKDLL